ncbi:RlpA-like double-psi beta-barrel-protein domain-containing protein-containing protein [Pilobolus umbonatus]|nr:RlpA-like double-psi beta-barrel-protein domain-containing protein-containing protein [Pilobolus umbonatus]
MNKLGCLFYVLWAIYGLQQTEGLPVNIDNRAISLKFSGIGTYYDVGSGSCGSVDSNSQLVVALSSLVMKNVLIYHVAGPNPNKNPMCNKQVKIVGLLGKTTYARVVDTCPSCDKGHLDMSPALFKKVCGDLGLGICKINWEMA